MGPEVWRAVRLKFLPPLRGQQRQQGVIGLQDLAAFAGNFGKSEGDPGYLANFDYYGTGTAGLSGLLQLLRRLGKRV